MTADGEDCAFAISNWIKWNVPLEGGALMVGNDVLISLDIEADLVE